MLKPTTGFDINVDEEIKVMNTKYPRFESVNAGYWLYGKPKELLKGVFEDRKTFLYYIFNIKNSISTLETLYQLNKDYMKDGVGSGDLISKNHNLGVGLSQLKDDLKQFKLDYAKTFVFEQLLKLKIKQGEK